MDEEDLYDEDDDRCEYCGAGPYDPPCIMCKSCFGMYAPGSEDCDWCPFGDECAKQYEECFR